MRKSRYTLKSGFALSLISFSILVIFSYRLLAQVDPNQGTAVSTRGAAMRILEPTLYDAVFPVIAFMLVIVVPTFVALMVIVRIVMQTRHDRKALIAYLNRDSNNGAKG